MYNAKDRGFIKRFEAEYSWLSNFYMEPCGTTNEHRYQAAKAKDYPEERRAILNAPSPGKAKRLGRTVPCDMKWWHKARVKAMEDGLRTKFSNPMLRDLLLQTGDTVLIEGNMWHDDYWGNCYCSKCDTLGHNVLGIMLMTLRDELREIEDIPEVLIGMEHEELKELHEKRECGAFCAF